VSALARSATAVQSTVVCLIPQPGQYPTVSNRPRPMLVVCHVSSQHEAGLCRES
jgi:hypothetical protein